MFLKKSLPFYLFLSIVLTPNAPAQFVQLGSKLVGTGFTRVNSSPVSQGSSVAVSANGNTLIVGAKDDNGGVGAAWIFTRSNGSWSQQGNPLTGSDASSANAAQGSSVALSADGNTALVGGPGDAGGLGAAWVYTRTGGIWSQQGTKLTGAGASANALLGTNVALSADGNTALVGAPGDGATGAVWVFTRTAGVWSQQGSKFAGSGSLDAALQGYAVALSADGNTALVGGPGDNQNTGAVWIFKRTNNVWSQQGAKVVGAGGVKGLGGSIFQGCAVALSGDGNTALAGGRWDNGSAGAVWVFTRANGVWTQQGNKLTTTSGGSYVGTAVALSGDGNTAFVGAPYDPSAGNFAATAWTFKRSGDAWSQEGGSLSGNDSVVSSQGVSVSLSADGSTAILGGPGDNFLLGATWAFVQPVAVRLVVTAPSSANAGTSFSVTVTSVDAGGNTITGYAGTVHFTSTDANAILPSDATLTNGTATFTATLKTLGSQTITATDFSVSSILGISGSIAVAPGSAAKFAVSAPAATVVGTAFSVSVTAQDAYNNTVTAYSGTVSFTSTDGAAVVPGNSALTNGTGTFSATLNTIGSQSIAATDTLTASITGSATIAVGGVATHFTVSAPPSAAPGAPVNITVTALDASSHTVTTYAGRVHFASTDAAAVVPLDAALTNGTRTFVATFKTPGNQSITATDSVTASINGTSSTIVVSPWPDKHFLVTAPASAVAGASFQFTVTALDAANNVIPDYNGTVQFSSTDATAVLPGSTTLSNGTGTFTATLRTAGSQSITASDAGQSGHGFGTITGNSGPIVVSAGVVARLSVTAPASATAGTAFNIAVSARDAWNNASTVYAGTVHFISSDPSAVLPSDTTLTNGTGTVAVTLKTAGSQSITATDTVTASITGSSAAIVVTGGAATHLVVSAPASANAGAAIAFTVTAQDTWNNIASSYAGTLHFTSSDTVATLPANATLTNGTASFQATLKTVGNQTITATDTVTGSIAGSSATIAVAAGGVTHFALTAPTTATAGTAFNFTVTAKDAANNTLAGYSGTVHFSSADTVAVLPANTTLTNGTGTFQATLKTAGSQTITASDTVATTVTGDSAVIAVAGAAATHFVVAAPASATAGTAFNVVVTAKDAYQNTSTAYAGTVHFTSSDSAALVPSDALLTNGTVTLSATLKTSGSQTLTATDTTNTSITGVSGAIVVTGAAATHFAVSAPASATPGTAFNVIVTAQDASNNTATGYTGAVHFSSSDAAAVLPANSVLTNGTGTFTATLNTAGSQTITAADAVTASISGTSGAIAVTVGSATRLVIASPASVTAGTAFTFTVTAKDSGNTTITGYSGTVHFTSSDGSAILPGNATLTNGTGSFPVTLKTSGAQTITASDTTTPSINGNSGAIAVAGAAATVFSVSAPSTVPAGTMFSFAVTARDAFGNTAVSYPGTVHFTSSDAAAILPLNTTLSSGTGTFSAMLKALGNQTIAVTDTVTSSIAGNSGNIAVVSGGATHFAVTAPASANPGSPISFTVTALDAQNNVNTGYAGTVRCTSSDGAAVMPANWTLVNGTGTFSATFQTPGNQSITATDTVAAAITGNSGTIMVSGGTVAASAEPGWGGGTSKAMTFTFTDAHGWQHLDVVNVLINDFLDGRNACYLAYSRSASMLYLVPDSGGGLLPGIALNGSGATANSQCAVTSSSSSATGSGNTLTLTLNLSFTTGFAGNKVTYLAARDMQGDNSGWQALGTWAIPVSSWSGPQVGGVSPERSSGSGQQTYTFAFNDSNGWQDLGVVNVLVNDALNGNHACYLAYSRANNVLYLVNDAGNALLPGMVLNGSGSLSNSQCSINGAGSSASGSGNTLSLTLNVTFSSSFAGNRLIYMAARSNGDALNSGWRAAGSRTVQ